MDFHLEFDGHEIIVTRPGTDMMTAYRKRPDGLVSESAANDPKRTFARLVRQPKHQRG